MNKALNSKNKEVNISEQYKVLHDDLLRIEKLLQSHNVLLQTFLTSLGHGMTGAVSFKELTSIPAWKPPSNNLVLPQSLSNYNLRKIGFVESKRSILDGLKASAFGRFYEVNLKKISMLRYLANWVFRVGYPIYKRYQQYCKHVPLYLPIKFNDYLNTVGIERIRIFDAETVSIPKVEIFPDDFGGAAVFEGFTYNYPPVYIAKITKGIIRGGTNLILVEDKILLHDLYDLQTDYSSEELHGRHFINVNKMRISLSSFTTFDESIPVAASFVDACAHNYAHWITEVLSRVATFCSIEEFKDVPIIVNDELHPNLMASLRIVAGVNREIILLPIGMQLKVTNLYVTSVTGYVAFEPRNNSTELKHQGLFSSKALSLLRNSVTKAMTLQFKDVYPKRIYLRRNSGARNIVNADEIERYLVENGFSIIETEKLSFLEQVQLFAGAEIVLGAGGAAFANAIFLNEGAKIGVMVANHQDMLYRYWPAIVNCFQKLDFHYILGLTDKASSDRGVHSDFYIPLEVITRFICKK